MLGNLGIVAQHQGESAAELGLIQECLAIIRELSGRMAIAYRLHGIAALNAGEGTPRHAARLRGAADRLREEIGSPPSPITREKTIDVALEKLCA